MIKLKYLLFNSEVNNEDYIISIDSNSNDNKLY